MYALNLKRINPKANIPKHIISKRNLFPCGSLKFAIKLIGAPAINNIPKYVDNIEINSRNLSENLFILFIPIFD